MICRDRLIIWCVCVCVYIYMIPSILDDRADGRDGRDGRGKKSGD